MTLLAALAAALAGWLLWGPPPTARLRDGTGGARPGGVARLGGLLPVAAVGAAGVLGLLLRGVPGAAIAVAAALPVLTAVTVWRSHRRRARAETRAAGVSDACQLLAGLLRVGHVPAAALHLAARDAPVLAEAAAVQRIGGSVSPVLRARAREAGRGGLGELAVAWEVAERTGASLTATLDSLAERLSARRAVRNVVATELSASLATGRLLAVLPAVGVLLGYSFGGDPFDFLTGSVVGQVCLVLGSGLGCAGVLWTERIAAPRAATPTEERVSATDQRRVVDDKDS
ncbi:MAG: type II secretion system F family protein [Propionicimonas sp.]|uniref:type II secretion system F family protein n=1 Tax=Propionicimonas sp. TaxID=1955623 RepID=UPI003D118955